MAKGMAAAQKAVKEAQQSGSGAPSGKLFYFNWKDGDTKIIRFLTDDVITCEFYEWVLDKDGKTQNFLIPASVYADEDGVVPPEYEHLTDWVREVGKSIPGGLKSKEYGTNNLVDIKPVKKTVAIAVLLEEFPIEVDGKIKMSYRDAIEPIEVRDQEYPARQFGIIKQSYKNFWVQLVGYNDEYGTICDRPYKITRRGKKDTVYQIIPLAPDPEFDIKALQADYGYGEPRNEDDEDRFLFCPRTLDDWAEDYGSERRVKFFLLGEEGDSRPAPASNGNGLGEFKKETTSNPEPVADEAQAAAPPATRDYGSLRDRLDRHRK